MKRLIKKSDTFQQEPVQERAEQNINNVEENNDLDGMVELDQLSEADVRHERCPKCKYNPLKRKDGFKVCPRCEQVYKVLDGKAYMISQ